MSAINTRQVEERQKIVPYVVHDVFQVETLFITKEKKHKMLKSTNSIAIMSRQESRTGLPYHKRRHQQVNVAM